MRPGPSPLVGYNTNVRHKGKLFHIQTEDSGINHPHVITHLFADGGRIVASRKTAYAEHLGAKDLQSIVKKLMQEQHKAMFIELRDCVYDEDGGAAEGVRLGQTEAVAADAARAEPAAEPAPEPARAPAAPRSERPQPSMKPPSSPELQDLDVEALERAAEARIAESAAGRARVDGPRRGAGRYQQTVAAKPDSAPPKKPSGRPSIFGDQGLRGKSLDEVILSYLSDDVGEREKER
jgi:hypothetical protein